MARRKGINIYIPKYIMAVGTCINIYIPKYFYSSRGESAGWNELPDHFVTVHLIRGVTEIGGTFTPS